ncbi:hypothetical protein [Halovivax limisalsi]|uniref:hypothetical protein n=1 Tax=Halovivax limisalsi TaxID=1453760 RepID=UPI001FFCD7F7|nr:hypothetical protein [Halovivax limisalsi]
MAVAIGMLFMLGFAGGAAAQDVDWNQSGGDGGDGGFAWADSDVEQTNSNNQAGNAQAWKGDAGVINVQDSTQVNAADTTVTADASGGDGGDGGNSSFDIDFDNSTITLPIT